MHKVQDKPVQATASLKFFDWSFKNGDKTADDLDYVPMPVSVKAAIDCRAIRRFVITGILTRLQNSECRDIWKRLSTRTMERQTWQSATQQT